MPEDDDPAESKWVAWSPSQHAHVKGEYTERTFDLKTGLPEPQDFRVTCEYVDPQTGQACGGKWGGSCSSGAVRRHIQLFAASHRHADPLAGPRIVRPGSLRTNGEDQ
jgi:hypothetical protein